MTYLFAQLDTWLPANPQKTAVVMGEFSEGVWDLNNGITRRPRCARITSLWPHLGPTKGDS